MDDLDFMPLIKRRKMLHSNMPYFSSTSLMRSPAVKRVSPGALQDWPGLPRGVKFNPSDEELLWHLLAKVGIGEAEPHPLISEFIISLDEGDGFGYYHPHKLPGVKQDGSVSYFFHRTFRSYDTKSQKHQKIHNDDFGIVRWHKIGKTKPVYMDGIHQGSKKIMVLYTSMTKDKKPENTNWVMQQYHVGTREYGEGEFVVSKIFYQLKSRQGDKNAQPLDTVEAVGTEVEPAAGPKLMGPEPYAENPHPDLISMEASIQDLSSTVSVNLMNNINECSTGRVKDEIHSADTLLCLEEQYVGNVEHDAGKYMGNPLFESLDSVIGGSPVTVDQSSPNLPNCLNSVSLKGSHSQGNQERDNMLPNQISASEIKLPVVGGGHGHMNSSSQPHSSTFSTFLFQLKSEPLEENYAENISETNVAIQYSTDILGFPDRGNAACSCTITPCLSEARAFPDHPSSRSSKSLQNQRSNHKCSNASCIPEPKLSSLGERLAQTDNNQVSNSVLSVIPLEVKAEPFEECKTKSVPDENDEKLPSSSLSGCPTERSSSVTLCSSKANHQDNLMSDGRVSKENMSTGYICSNQTTLPEDVHHNSRAAELLSIPRLGSLDNAISKNSCIVHQCSPKDANFHDNILSSRSNLQEHESIFFDQASLPEIDFDAKNKLSNSISSSCPDVLDQIPLGERIEMPASGNLTNLSCDNNMECSQQTVLLSGPVNSVNAKESHFSLRRRKKKKRERIEMTASRNLTNLSCDNNMECSQQTVPLSGPVNSVNAKESHFSQRRRKMKKTATDSVETALEEDAPGLLQVLLDKGITADEIKLYGEVDDDKALEISSTEDSFEELETVIAKLFSAGPSLFKFPSVRQIKGSKAVYCLSCLISLIEQTRYLRFRDSPVEWGWCRDLQSFIFIFERHNRIVLERPEYGYATYFFELVESLPIDWQIKRLVTAMKLPSCSRTTLLENRSLLVGQDLTEGEARVLEEYGWTPNSGLGTMLNYRDRVVHDKINDMYSSEWRAKIGKMLMSGHDGGRTVLSNLPKKALQYMWNHNPEIKLEL